MRTSNAGNQARLGLLDNLTPQQRKLSMSRVASRNTRPEIAVRRVLHRLGYRFRLHQDNLPGSPDIVLPRQRIAVFVHGCFWHGHSGCVRAARPSTNVEFWNRKLDVNIQRDVAVQEKLAAAGWTPIVLWQCTLKSSDSIERAILVGLEPIINAKRDNTTDRRD